MRRYTLVSLLVLLALAAAMLSGCAMIAQKATEAAVEKTTGVKVDNQGQKITATDKNGNTVELTAKEGKYPDNFPSDFPQYPNGTVGSALANTSDGQESFTVIVKTPDAPKDVYDWYLAELEKGSWKVDQKMDGTTSDAAFASVSALNGDRRAGVTLSKGTDETETSIMISIGPSK